MDNELNDFLDECAEVTNLLVAENYQLSDIGLTSKVAFDWSGSGLYLRERKSKYRRKYNGIEYVWLRLVKELREFGLSIQSIKTLKEFLLKEQEIVGSIEELMEQYLDSLKDSPKTLIEAIKELKLSFDVDLLEEQLQESLLNTHLAQIIFWTIIGKSDTHILITKDGNCMVFENNPLQDTFVSSQIMNAPYISFPINYIVSDFIGREELYDLSVLEERYSLSDQEAKVLELLKQDNISSLTVKLDHGQISLIETEEDIDVKDVRGKLVDLMEQRGYQEISYKTQNGNIVTMKRKTKHKL